MDSNYSMCNTKQRHLHPAYNCNGRSFMQIYTRNDIDMYQQPFMNQRNRYVLSPHFIPIFNKIYDYQNFPQLRPLNCETDTFEPQNYNRYMDKWNTRWSF
jgi:hypothetical protein